MKLTPMATLILGLSAPLFWGIILALSVIVELATFNVVSIWFAIAALVSMVASFLGASIVLQFVLFGLLSVAGFLVFIFLVRPRLERRAITPTNADRIMGREGLVTQTLNSTTGQGQIRVAGQVWSARTEEEGIVREGTPVRITAIRGVKAIVQPLEGSVEPLE